MNLLLVLEHLIRIRHSQGAAPVTSPLGVVEDGLYLEVSWGMLHKLPRLLYHQYQKPPREPMKFTQTRRLLEIPPYRGHSLLGLPLLHLKVLPVQASMVGLLQQMDTLHPCRHYHQLAYHRHLFLP